MKTVRYVFFIVLASLTHLNQADDDEIISTNTNETGFLIHNLIHQEELVDTDIRLPPGTHKEDYFLAEEDNKLPPLPAFPEFGRQFAARKKDDLSKLWTIPIPYVIDESVDSIGNLGINDGMKQFEKKTCIRFRKKDDADHDYLKFVGNEDGCWSYVGRQGTGEQVISLENVACRKFKTVIHEIMHAIGFWHEHSRPDRDKYVRIHYENIKPGQGVNFQKLKDGVTESFGVDYDYKSVMHYYGNAFSKNGNNTITRVDGEPSDFGQPAHGSFSPKDLEQVNMLYDCTGTWGSWVNGNCNVYCGTGQRTLTRECVGKPGCIGESKRYEECKMEPCKSEGEWSEWHSSLCNATCGEGFKIVTRDCYDPKTHHATENCIGENLKYERCNLPPCKGYGIWGSWTEGPCNVRCGSGVRTLTRSCHSGPRCSGKRTKHEACHKLPCDCFPSNTYVRTKNGSKIAMNQLKLGDEVLTISTNGLPIYSKIIMMLHNDSQPIINDYVQIKTLDNKELEMSSKHLIPIANHQYIFAEDVREGDDITIYDESENSFRKSKVASTSRVIESGLYAPLTLQGTILVNDVLVSCYATYPSHTLSHLAFEVWRFIYSYLDFISDYFSRNNDGVHWYPRTLYSIATTVGVL